MNKGEKLVHPRPRRWNCARQEYHWDSNSQNAHTRNQGKVFVPASVVQITQRWSWKKLLPFHCGQVVNPDKGEVEYQVLLPSLSCSMRWFHYRQMSVACQCGNICFVATDTRVKEPGVRDRRQCHHGCHKDMWSGVWENKHQRGRSSLPYPPEAVFHPVQSQ